MWVRTLAISVLVFVRVAHTHVPVREPPPSSELVRNASAANDALAGVGQFRGPLRCTGSLIDPSGSAASDAKAWLLTAGHCISLEPYGVIRNQALTAQVQFNFFIDTPDKRVTVRTRAIGWSTMKGTDLGLVELDATLGDLRASGIRPVRLSPTRPEPGRAVFWTGISGSPIPAELQFLRLGRCTLGRREQVLEGPWIWHDHLLNNCPDLYEGASGSPLFDAESGEIVGVIGTSTLLNFEQGPDYDCQRNRPCVARAGGPVMQRDTSYASPIQGIDRCFDRSNALDVQRPGCPLDPGFQLTVQSGATEVLPEVEGKPATWSTALSGSQRFYAYKYFPMGEGDCGMLSGYSVPISVAASPVIDDPIGSRDGYYFLCVIAGDMPSFDASWQQPSFASVRFKRLDSQPPVVTADYELQQLTDAFRLVNLTGGDGPSGLGLGFTKRGPPSTDCSDPQGYRVQISIPEVVRTSDLPTRICWKISDKAGNSADPVVFDFGAPALLPNAIRNAASLARGTVAMTSKFRVDSFNLTDVAEVSPTPVAHLAGVRISVVDSAGAALPVMMTKAGPFFVEAVMPETAAPGKATLVVQPPRGPSLSQPFEIRRTAAGLFFETDAEAPRGYAADAEGNLYPLVNCPAQGGCYTTQLPLSSTPGGLDFFLYGTGFRAADKHLRARIGTHTLDVIEITPHPGIAGVDKLRFHLPRDFPLVLYQPVSVETRGAKSNHLWIYLE